MGRRDDLSIGLHGDSVEASTAAGERVLQNARPAERGVRHAVGVQAHEHVVRGPVAGDDQLPVLLEGAVDPDGSEHSKVGRQHVTARAESGRRESVRLEHCDAAVARSAQGAADQRHLAPGGDRGPDNGRQGCGNVD